MFSGYDFVKTASLNLYFFLIRPHICAAFPFKPETNAKAGNFSGLTFKISAYFKKSTAVCPE